MCTTISKDRGQSKGDYYHAEVVQEAAKGEATRYSIHTLNRVIAKTRKLDGGALTSPSKRYESRRSFEC